MTETQRVKKTCEAIINAFETGTALPKYDALYVLDDGAGITYGRAGATDREGNLDKIVVRYLDLGGKYASQLRPYLPSLADPRMPLTNNTTFKNVLVVAARTDPLMIQAQTDIFDAQYWIPATRRAQEMGLVSPLSICVVYDSFIQGSFDRVRLLFPEVPPVRGGGEQAWVRAYVSARRGWLARHSKKILNKTVYRMDFFNAQMLRSNWMLNLPFRANGVLIDDRCLV